MNLMVKNNSVSVARVSGTTECILYQFWGEACIFCLKMGGQGGAGGGEVDRVGCCWVSLRAGHQANSLTVRTILTI